MNSPKCNLFVQKGKEAIFFQADSPLYKDLIEAFKAGCIYRDTLDYTNASDKQRFRHASIHAWAKTKLFPKLTDVIKKHTNIHLYKIVDVNMFCGVFAIDTSLGDAQAAQDMETNFTGAAAKPIPITEAMQELTELASAIDYKNSTFKVDSFGKNKSRKLKAALYLDIDMFYLMKDNIANDLIEDMTPEEMAAICLHEIGHIFTIVESCQYTYYTVQTTKDHLKAIMATRSLAPADFPKAYNKLKPTLTKLVAAKVVSPKILELGNTAEALAKYQTEISSQDYISGTLEFLSGVILNILRLCILICMRATVTMTFLLAIDPLMALFEPYMGKGSQAKVSDVQNMPQQSYYVEKIADEFAVRHGAGAGLASGLRKIAAACQIAEAGGELSSASLRTSVIFSTYLKGVILLIKALRLDSESLSNDFTDSNYEKQLNRVRRMAQDIVAVFKTKLPKEMAFYYIADYENVLATLDSMKNGVPIISDALYKWVIRRPMTLLENIGVLNIDKNWEDNANELSEIINNKMYYHAQKFTVLTT